jgi:hypothetical protein
MSAHILLKNAFLCLSIIPFSMHGYRQTGESGRKYRFVFSMNCWTHNFEFWCKISLLAKDILKQYKNLLFHILIIFNPKKDGNVLLHFFREDHRFTARVPYSSYLSCSKHNCHSYHGNLLQQTLLHSSTLHEHFYIIQLIEIYEIT